MVEQGATQLVVEKAERERDESELRAAVAALTATSGQHAADAVQKDGLLTLMQTGG